MKHTVLVYFPAFLLSARSQRRYPRSNQSFLHRTTGTRLGAIFRNTRAMVIFCCRKTSMNGFTLARL